MISRQKSRAHSSQAKKFGREDLATRPIIVQDSWPGSQSDMLNVYNLQENCLIIKIIKINTRNLSRSPFEPPSIARVPIHDLREKSRVRLID